MVHNFCLFSRPFVVPHFFGNSCIFFVASLAPWLMRKNKRMIIIHMHSCIFVGNRKYSSLCFFILNKSISNTNSFLISYCHFFLNWVNYKFICLMFLLFLVFFFFDYIYIWFTFIIYCLLFAWWYRYNDCHLPIFRYNIFCIS